MSVLQGTARKAAGLVGRESWPVRRLRPAYESLLEWSSAGKGIEWVINGVTFRVDPRYRHRMGSNYDPQAASFLRDRIQAGAVCLNVGANVGVYVLQFANWSGETGRVVAFEPNPVARDALRRHVQMNNLSARVTIVPTAVGASTGNAFLYAAEAAGMSRLGEPNPTIADRVSEISVPVVTLDAYCETERLIPDWMFIDIEGYEIAALLGASQLIKSRGRKMEIIVEMHPSVWDSANTSRAGAEQLLRELRLRVIPLEAQKDPLAEHGLVYLKHAD
jgi:FkbM family methyltransferase